MQKPSRIILIIAFPFIVLLLALVFAGNNASKSANYPKHTLQKAIAQDKKAPHPSKIKLPSLR